MATTTLTQTYTLHSGDKMPAFGLGTWLAAPNVVGEAVKVALVEGGYKHIDCAAIYGNEEEVGKAFAYAFSKGIKREDIFITSKLWITEKKAQDVRPAFMKTLHDLGLKYLDLYIIHWKITWKKNAAFPPVPENYIDIPTIETWRELEKLVDEGFIRNIGVSNFTSCDIEKFWHQARIKPAVNQVEMHPLLQQAKLREYCAIRGIHMTAYSSLGNNESPFRGQFPNILENPTICRIAGKHKKSSAQILLRWALQQKVTIIPKSTKKERIIENSQLDFALDNDDMAAICCEDRHARTAGSLFLNGKKEAEFWDYE